MCPNTPFQCELGLKVAILERLFASENALPVVSITADGGKPALRFYMYVFQVPGFASAAGNLQLIRPDKGPFAGWGNDILHI